MGGMVRAGAVRTPAVDVVILTVIPAELDAARRVLQIDDLDREKDTDGTMYFRGAVRSELSDRDYAIALGCIGGAGNPGAAAAAASAIATFHPRVVLLMGIAAGLRDKVRIGEVVLSDRVVAYEPAALVRTTSGAKEQPRPEIDRAPHTILQDVVSYRPDPSRLRAAFDRAGGILPAAPAGREDEFRAHVASTITTRLGTIASGEKLLRDPARLVAVREQHGKTEAGEMEAAGLVDACRRGSVPWLVIRGISDLATSSRTTVSRVRVLCSGGGAARLPRARARPGSVVIARRQRSCPRCPPVRGTQPIRVRACHRPRRGLRRPRRGPALAARGDRQAAAGAAPRQTA